MANSVKTVDRGARRLGSNLGGGAGKTGRAILVGIQGQQAAESKKYGEGESEDGDLTVGMVAAFHEFGLGVPERSWLRGWVDENRAMIQEDMKRAMRQVLLGRTTVDQVAHVLGVKWVASIQARIVAHIAPALDEATVEAKGSSTPLVDTGQLKSAITFIVEGALAKTGGPVVSA